MRRRVRPKKRKPPFTIAAAIASLAVAGIGVASAVKGGPKTTSTSTLEFPEETRRLFQNIELPTLAAAQGEQQNLINPFLGGGPLASPFLTQQYGSAPVTAMGAAKHSAATTGLGDLGPVQEGVGGLTPELFANLQNLVLARGAQVNSVVAPGYGQFLSPATHTQTDTPGPSPFAVGFQVAGSLAGAGNTYLNATR
jgi:hypothetical protein